jgi:hypothetical protein
MIQSGFFPGHTILTVALVFSVLSITLNTEVPTRCPHRLYRRKELSPLKNTFRLFLLSLAFAVSGASALAADANCYRDVCVGDRAINVTNNYREVTVLGIDNSGKFVLRFEDNGGVGGNWDREDLALETGCTEDLCVGYPAFNVSSSYRTVTVAALQWNGKFVLRFDDNGGVGGNWNRSDLAVAWGCVENVCVNDTIYNNANGRQATVAAIQTSTSGLQDRMVLRFLDNGGVGGNWQSSEVVLLQRGPPAYPPGPPIPTCPPGTHYDPSSNRCVPNLPPPPPHCPPGTHYDPRIGRCVANLPPPPPPQRNWICSIAKPGRTFTGAGPTRASATQAVMNSCAIASGGYVCRASEAFCSQ